MLRDICHHFILTFSVECWSFLYNYNKSMISSYYCTFFLKMIIKWNKIILSEKQWYLLLFPNKLCLLFFDLAGLCFLRTYLLPSGVQSLIVKLMIKKNIVNYNNTHTYDLLSQWRIIHKYYNLSYTTYNKPVFYYFFIRYKLMFWFHLMFIWFLS